MRQSAEHDERASHQLEDITRTVSLREDTSMAEEDALLDAPVVTDEDIDSFATEHGLADYIDLLHTAAKSLRGNESNHNKDNDDPTASNVPARKWRQPLQMYLTIVVTAFGAMGQGWSQTGINGANLDWPTIFGLGVDTPRNNFVVGAVNAAMYISNGLIGLWLVTPLNRGLGRRGATFVGALISTAANIMCGLTSGWLQLLFSRFLLGIGLAVICSTLNVFAAESAPASIRGGLAVSWQMFCAFGIFTGFVANLLIAQHPGDISLKWRVMISAPMLTNLPLLAMLYTCPESPSWHIKTNSDFNAAFKSLQRLRNTNVEAAEELLGFYAQHTSKKKSATTISYLSQFTQLFSIPRNRRATLAAYTTMLAQQLCGINIIAFYSSTIFIGAGFSEFAAYLASIIFGFVNFLGAFPAVWTMDSLGRRSLLLLTLLPMALSMAVAGFSFSISDGTVRFGMITSMIYMFCLLYSPDMGPVPPSYSAEVFPLSHRETEAASAIATANLFAAVLSLTFPYLLSVLGNQGSFLLYAALNVLAWVLIFLFVPETKQKTSDELDEVFEIPTRRFVDYQTFEYAPWWLRRYTKGDTAAMFPDLKPRRGPGYTEVDQDDDYT